MSENRRESRRWPYAFAALLGGTILGVLIVLAVRGPSVVVVNSGCCCCEAPCETPVAGRRLGATIPVLPEPEPLQEPVWRPGPEPEPEPEPEDSRIAGLIPVIPWLNGGGSGGDGGHLSEDTGKVNPVPEPGVLALVAGGLLAWRLS